ncbi:MAG: TylF/MycF family methyltransferase [Gemmataceae bacterium]
MPSGLSAEAIGTDLYLDLLKRVLCASVYPESSWQVVTGERAGASGLAHRLRRWAVNACRRRGLMFVKPRPFDPSLRESGRDYPCFGYSMIGLRRMTQLQECVEAVIGDDIPGDLIETGVWRGGAAILMRAVLRRYGVTDRTVWAADSFDGLPPPRAEVDRLDLSFDLSEWSYLKVSLESVRAAFESFGLLDDQVRFLKGWFKDTLATAPIERLSVLRLDGDMYESTIDAITPLYPKLSPGGFVIVDDYFGWPGCRRAVDEYRSKHGITAKLIDIDGAAAYWRVG